MDGSRSCSDDARAVDNVMVERALGRTVISKELRPVTPDGLSGCTRLSSRERQVLVLLAEGLTDKEVADRLNISVHTVDNHVRRILYRIGAVNRTHAVAIAFRARLLPSIDVLS